MKAKKTIITSSILALGTGVGYLAICSKLFKDTMVRGVVSTPEDSTDYSLLNQKNDEAKIWFLKQEYEKFEIITKDNLLIRGRTLVHPNQDKWIVLAHGYKCDYTSILYQAKKFYEDGFNILVYDQRGHGKSEGQYISMGYLEQHDIIKLCEFIISKNKSAKIALYGVSMGASTVMFATGNKLPINVVCAIEDCGYTSVYDIFLDQGEKKYNIDISPILAGIGLFVRRNLKFSIKQASCLKQLAKSTTPTLFIHGNDDDYVPYEMVYHNYEACNAKKDIWVVDNQQHATACLDSNYFIKVTNFINQYM